ncbi:hypothetical protein [Sporolactobacillus pectinivorans]|uniref:hypothetical protein n=1 Tax=Sporolactobacillus pectinivorans TaxID=1591408 RepID=UPI0012FD997F|nr:hypothetical protein [Sporolactobacillus pectinivorans]
MEAAYTILATREVQAFWAQVSSYPLTYSHPEEGLREGHRADGIRAKAIWKSKRKSLR